MNDSQFLNQIAAAIVRVNETQEEVQKQIAALMGHVDQEIAAINKRLDHVETLSVTITQQTSDMADLVGSITGLPAATNLNPSRIGDRLTRIENQLGAETKSDGNRIDRLEADITRIYDLLPDLKPITTDDVIAPLKSNLIEREKRAI